MTQLLLIIITIILSLDFYLKYNILIKKKFRKIDEPTKQDKKPKWEFWIDKKWVWDKVKEELTKQAKNIS